MIDENIIKKTYKGIFRLEKLPSCSLRKQDLHHLYRILKEKTKEAGEIEIKEMNKPKELTEYKYENLKKDTIKCFELNIAVATYDGLTIAGSDELIFKDEIFNGDIKSILFDSTFYHKFYKQIDPRNYFILNIEFDKTSLFDFSNLIEKPSSNSSYFHLSGTSTTWVMGVKEQVLNFLKSKKKKRGWLYNKQIGNLVAYFFSIPIALWALYKCYEIFKIYYYSIPIIPLVGINIYLFLLFVFLLRVLFNYTRWLFPFIEFDDSKESKKSGHRITLISILLGLFIAFIYDIFTRFVFVLSGRPT